MSILDKCTKFDDAENIKKLGYYPYFRVITSEQDTEVIVNGKKMLMMGSNSYLGLTNHPRVKEAAINATKKYGTGCAGSRFLNGTIDIHIELEAKLAKLVGKDGALAFATGYQSNLGAISAMVVKDEYIVTDKYDHASIIDGCKMSYGKMLRYNHNDMASLENALKRTEGKNTLVVVDGIFSMEGDIADVPGILEVIKKYNANLMIDEAHSLGVLSKDGAGTAKYFDAVDDTSIIMGTFSKSLASVGGFLAADKNTIDYLKHHSRPLIFSASLPPASAASVLEALKINPYYRPAKLNLGAALSLRGKYNIAKSHLRQADKAAHGGSMRVLFALIENSVKAGSVEDAEHYTEKLTSKFSYKNIMSMIDKIKEDKLSVPVNSEIIIREVAKKMKLQIEEMETS